MLHKMLHIRNATLKDINGILDVQSDVYDPAFIEKPSTFEDIIIYNRSFIAEIDGDVIGYLLVHPWGDITSPPALHTHSPNAFTTPAKVWFIHDLCVLSEYHHQGIGTLLIEALKSEHREPSIATLIAVNDTSVFWKKHGFKVFSCDKAILDTYNDQHAVYMIGKI
jgi:N-acetylglutamate synthase-like GNAT family acetyltransferase